MKTKDVVEILMKSGVDSVVCGDDNTVFCQFVPIMESGPGDAVMIRDSGDIASKIEYVNSLKPSLSIVPTRLVKDVKCGSIIGVDDPRLAFAIIQTELLKRDKPKSDYPDLPRWVYVGKNVFIDKYCNIGCDGLSANKHNGGLVHTPHSGRVIIGDNVRVHSFCAVERAVMGETRIGDDCHIDYHCVIGHGAKLGKQCRLAPGVLILGGARIGNDVAIGAGAIINPGVAIGDGAAIGAGSVVTHDIEDGVLAYGSPATPRNYAKDARGATW